MQLDFSAARRILCLGCHADDVEIGCGGTLLRLAAENPGRSIRWLVLSGAGTAREAEARASAAAFLAGLADARVDVLDFPDRFFPTRAEDLKRRLHAEVEDFRPDLVFGHRLEDAHQDHRLVAEIARQACRRQPILEYEIPKYEGDLATPNLYVALPEALARRKAELLLAHFPSQREKPWFRVEAFLGLSAVRAVECGEGVAYAEGFVCRKAVWR